MLLRCWTRQSCGQELPSIPRICCVRVASSAALVTAVAMIIGLPRVGFEELFQFDSGALGMALDLRTNETGAVLLAGPELVGTGDGVVGLGRLPDIPVGQAMLGRSLDPLGNPLDGGPELPSHERLPLFRPAPDIIQRKSVDQPLWTRNARR